ncbi:MAG: hypothetical protein HYT50_01790 [Candidatus Wildermuthbacteria bacterium]|nr:hypothetical protein [Candidatus Wildermuthbacteria bacterium]
MQKSGTKGKKKLDSTKKVGILGHGEVGQAIAKFFASPRIKDLSRKDDFSGIDVLHVCIPWSNNFVDIVQKEIREYQPVLVIVHSTVIPGTTKKVGSIAVHSPVRGTHPNLYEGVRTFVKYIGADDQALGRLAQEHLESVGMKTKLFTSSLATEVGKLLDTTYYGLCIAFHGEMKKLCDKLGVDFNDAVVDFNKTYNEGYGKLGMGHVARPVLYAPEGPIGGHCIIPNAELLSEFFKSKAIDLVLKYKKKPTRDKKHG